MQESLYRLTEGKHAGVVMDEPWARVVTAAGIPAVSAQSFRRTYENLARLAGVDQLVRRAVAGWRTTTAQDIYSEVGREDRDRAAAAIVGYVLAEKVRPEGTPEAANDRRPVDRKA